MIRDALAAVRLHAVVMREALQWARDWIRRPEWAAQAQMAAVHGYVLPEAIGVEGDQGWANVNAALAACADDPSGH